MPLVANVAIVTPTDVESITGEAGLVRLDEGSATIANACSQATNYLMLDLRGLKSVDPSLVSNTTDLMIPAALQAAFLRLVSQPDDESQKRAASLKARYTEAFSRYVFVSINTGDEQFVSEKGLPRSINQDAASFFPGTYNVRPGRYPPGGFVTK